MPAATAPKRPALHLGVPAVDRVMGPVPPGHLLLVRNDPGLDTAPFLMQAAAAQLQEKRSVVILVTDRAPSRVLETLAEHAPEADRSKFHIIDAHSGLMGAASTAAYPVANPADLMQVVARIEQASREHPGAALAIDSLSGLLDHADEARFLATYPRLLAAARRFAFTLATWTSWPYGPDVEKALAPDTTVRLRSVEEGVSLHQSLAIESRTKAATLAPTLYRADAASGVVLYVPKVVVLGPANAGKSTFVQTVSTRAVSVDRLGTTVAMDRGTAKLDGVTVEVFGTPGQDRFDPLLPTLAAQATAAILIVDATMPASFRRAKTMLDKIWRRGLRVVVALNKSDLKGALTPDEARTKLAVQPGVELIPCSAKDKASAQAVLRRLIDQVLSPGPGGAA